MTEQKKNLSASVHQRLYNHSKTSNEDFNLLLVRFANERFLYRLSLSEYKDRFLLKGASLFTLWFDAPHRPTRDIDLLGFGSSEIADIEKVSARFVLLKRKMDLISVPKASKARKSRKIRNIKA